MAFEYPTLPRPWHNDLILDEFLEMVMTIVYAGILLIAFNGPNSGILGNVGCEKWIWRKVADMTGLLIALFRMFIMDLIAFFINGLFLWKFCSINPVKELCRILKQYWPFISVTLGGAVTKVSLFYFLLLKTSANSFRCLELNITWIRYMLGLIVFI